MAQQPVNALAEDIYLRIKAEIFDFRLLPGDRFTETELSNRYSVSRTPVRDALYRLKREGYTEVAFRSSWSVSMRWLQLGNRLRSSPNRWVPCNSQYSTTPFHRPPMTPSDDSTAQLVFESS